jgi:hypothetical protein
MRSSWLWREGSPRRSLIIGGLLLALGLWDLFFVLFRSEDLLFTAGAALLLLVGSLNIWWGISRPGRGTTGSGPAR